ncbi:putative flagellar export pore protein [Wigglesworthia glossinidia endosymbiont of Glossina morsitans morsitans (Yale colony)]|uniref:Flagellar biosynthesis protein FlhA n=1 Tax=Wigglesworthia glossinidia endosymbiont of Glossina morsitans morsitans (Yale colony) TaxID=1142511 RepID=H6Q4B6_WIGGL|nr:flagellar biosynthesis protein FlhA [Wigglesworthia glossinidia]AFA40899.1 putative flagellar export pore protein [Wigglesworthia glossinidia endosymbiont of Glossina morsitans morsitans (Yale colony)]
MNNTGDNLIFLKKFFNQIKYKMLAGPIIIFMILFMMILPLPAFILDVMFTFNIVFSIIILLLTMFTRSILDFLIFPTILLFSTLLRLALNIASSRIILLNGQYGNSAAGKIIDAFGNFLVGGNFAVGIIVFSMLVIINFMVVTKGSVRIAEVGARFILDGMPGKQMAIDADLNSGLIGEEEAKKRRAEITQESDFYGSMDGASKFVRGDAVAGILIMMINLIGGLLIGTMQHNMDILSAGKTYTILTVGDGLIAQIPALIISTAAGVIVTRVTTQQNVSEQILSQLFNNPKVIFLSALIIGVFGLIPGMPNTIFLFFTCLLLFITWKLSKQLDTNSIKITKTPNSNLQKNNKIFNEATWNDVHQEDALGLEVGYKLINMVDNNKNNGILLKRIKGIRKQFAREMGFLPPVIHIRDNLEITPICYRILLNGVEIGSNEVYPEKIMAINPGFIKKDLIGKTCYEPAFGLPAVWISKDMQEEANSIGYTIVDASTVIATHFHSILMQYAGELFGRQEAQNLLEHLKKTTPKLVDGLIPEIISITTFNKILKNLLTEQISIRDMRSIIDCLAENCPQQNDIEILTSLVRQKLGRFITQNWFPKNQYKNEIQAIGLDSKLEKLLIDTVKSGSALEPKIVENLIKNVSYALKNQKKLKAPYVLLVNPVIRNVLSRLLRNSFPKITVLSTLEIIDTRPIKFTSIIDFK